MNTVKNVIYFKKIIELYIGFYFFLLIILHFLIEW